MGNAIDPDYKNFVKTIKSMVSSAQYEALRKVNKELQVELPGVKGFSARNQGTLHLPLESKKSMQFKIIDTRNNN